MNIVRAIEDEARGSMALASVARALSETSDVDAARPLFRLAFEDAVKTVNEKSRNEILRHILLEQTRAGLFNDAFTTAGSIKNREAQSRALLAMANVFIEADLYDEAIKLVVESHEVIDIQSGSADGLKSFYPGMRSVPIVVV